MKPLSLETRKIDGELLVVGRIFALKQFSKPERIEPKWRDRLVIAFRKLVTLERRLFYGNER